ncbi:MAG TPA: hypothetical protein VFQ22_09995 [Longimicrobiales bacterium]|nr:hypothetical protein [Longimicrobiales bacterium]
MPSPPARGTRLLLYEVGDPGDAAAVAAAVDLVVGRLCAELGRFIGQGGVAALAGRALSRAQRESPLLDGVRAQPEGRVSGLVEALGSAPAPEAVAAGTLLIDHLIGLLVSLMGEDVGLRPVRRLWPAVDLSNDP